MGEHDAGGDVPGPPGDLHLWRIGGDRVELTAGPGGWVARVRRLSWGGDELVVDGKFTDKDEALAWCDRMAHTLARDLEDAGGDRDIQA